MSTAQHPPVSERFLLLALGGIHALVLGSWYLLRPLRDEIATLDPELIPDLWTAVFFVMLAASPLFSWAVKRFSRRAFLGHTFRLFAVLLFGVSIALCYGTERSKYYLEIFFYVFCSVFNLFVVSVFWSFATDLLRARSAKRLFGPIAAGGTIGGLITSIVMSTSRAELPLWTWIAVTGGMVEAARLAILWVDQRILDASADAPVDLLASGATETRVSGGVLEGLLATFRSKYLLGVVIYLALACFNGSVYYRLQSELLKAAFPTREASGAFLANMNSVTNVATLVSQLFLNAFLLRKIGIGLTLLIMPLWSVGGLAALACFDTSTSAAAVLPTFFDASTAAAAVLPTFFVLEVGRRAISYSLAKPTKEYLFTLVPREEKYRSKNFIDTVVYRGSDMASAHGIDILRGLLAWPAFLGLVGILPGLLWAGMTRGLGRRAARRAAQDAGGTRAEDLS